MDVSLGDDSESVVSLLVDSEYSLDSEPSQYSSRDRRRLRSMSFKTALHFLLALPWSWIKISLSCGFGLNKFMIGENNDEILVFRLPDGFAISDVGDSASREDVLVS